jgi:stage V sporulation protein G
VTEVKLSLRNHQMVQAYVDIVLDDSLAIRDLRIIHSSRGCFVAMPSKTVRDGRRVDIVHPTTPEARRVIEEAVMAEYRKIVGELE